MASARVQRWSLLLGAYNYSIRFKAGKLNANADLLSLLPLPDCPSHFPTPPETVLLMELLEQSPVSAKQIKEWTSRDPILSSVRDFVIRGWRKTVDPALHPYHQRESELSSYDDCILWENRVIVPTAGRKRVLDDVASYRTQYVY